LIDLDKIRELIELMKEHDLSEVDLADGKERVSLKRGGAAGTPVMTAVAPAPMIAAPPAAVPVAAPPAEDDGLVAISSPMVGTYYAKPDPDADPFITVGAEITEETTVCIIEAMKVETAGTVERILVENEAPVEYGQPLILVRPPA
jgi:acetyl-CoA carboxylase biotin carboxyl carrier protein